MDQDYDICLAPRQFVQNKLPILETILNEPLV